MNTYVNTALNLNLKGTAHQFIVKLAMAADDDGVIALGTRKMPDIFAECGICYVTGYKRLREFEDQGLIEVVRVQNGNRSKLIPTHINLKLVQ